MLAPVLAPVLVVLAFPVALLVVVVVVVMMVTALSLLLLPTPTATALCCPVTAPILFAARASALV